MSMPIAEFARLLHIHPANTMIFLREIGLAFDETWPNVDGNLIETVRSLDPSKFRASALPVIAADASPAPVQEIGDELSDQALHILDKLERNRFWGAHKILKDKIKNHYCQSLHDIGPYLQELITFDLLLELDPNTYSLNQARTREINEILDRFRARKSSY